MMDEEYRVEMYDMELVMGLLFEDVCVCQFVFFFFYFSFFLYAYM